MIRITLRMQESMWSGSGKNCHNSIMLAFGGRLCSLSISSVGDVINIQMNAFHNSHPPSVYYTVSTLCMVRNDNSQWFKTQVMSVWISVCCFCQVFDTTRKITYKNLTNWYKELRQHRPEIPCVCAANKIDGEKLFQCMLVFLPRNAL